MILALGSAATSRRRRRRSSVAASAPTAHGESGGVCEGGGGACASLLCVCARVRGRGKHSLAALRLARALLGRAAAAARVAPLRRLARTLAAPLFAVARARHDALLAELERHVSSLKEGFFWVGVGARDRGLLGCIPMEEKKKVAERDRARGQGVDSSPTMMPAPPAATGEEERLTPSSSSSALPSASSSPSCSATLPLLP